MDEDFPALNPTQYLKTYAKVDRAKKDKPTTLITDDNNTTSQNPINSPSVIKREPLTTKNAVKYLLEGNLKSKVCRYCLNVVSELLELEQILEVANKGSVYKVTIKDMVSSFHPFKDVDDTHFPNKICDKCLDRTLSAYLFTQQCEQAERALRNCLEDINDKLNKLDPIDRPKKRGRQKLNPNFNTIHAEFEKVIDYAEPIIHLVNTASEPLTNQMPIDDLECLKCCEILPNMESLVNHSKSHPKSMWFNCRLCGQSYAKLYQLKRHFRYSHSKKSTSKTVEQVTTFECKRCGVFFEKYFEYLQHIEKHKFKTVMEHLVEKKMDRLCSVCLSKGTDMVPLDKKICLHGGCPELSGDRPLHYILGSTLPEMNILDNYTGTKVCQKCLNNALTSFIFTTQSYFVRKRLNTCVSVMLEHLNNLKDDSSNICIEIAKNTIMDVTKQEEKLLLGHDDDDDESKFDVDDLDEEFEPKLEETNADTEAKETKSVSSDTIKIKDEVTRENNLVNGFQNSLCNEFLKFKKVNPRKPKFVCPVCSKYFISDYFLKRHALKHIPMKIECKVCNLPFKSKFHVYEHKKVVHILGKNEFISCNVCGRNYTNEAKLKSHEMRHKHPFCQLCDKKFTSNRYFNCHMQRHVNKIGVIMKKYKQNCSFCEKDCPNDNELSLHVNKVHLQIKPYSCDMCERQFYTEYNLRSHKRIHSVRSKETCHFCNKTLYSRKHLVIHIRKHIGETPFYCQICNQSFYSQFKLRKHMTEGHGGTFCCKFCKVAFVTKKHLKEHISNAHNSWV